MYLHYMQTATTVCTVLPYTGVNRIYVSTEMSLRLSGFSRRLVKKVLFFMFLAPLYLLGLTAIGRERKELWNSPHQVYKDRERDFWEERRRRRSIN